MARSKQTADLPPSSLELLSVERGGGVAALPFVRRRGQAAGLEQHALVRRVSCLLTCFAGVDRQPAWSCTPLCGRPCEACATACAGSL